MTRLVMTAVSIASVGLLVVGVGVLMNKGAPPPKPSSAGQDVAETKEPFDLVGYRHLWNSEAEKAKMVVNPASKKKQADGWKPSRKLTEAESAKLMKIMANRFGEPGRIRVGYASFVYVWRFEGDEWLSVGVATEANLGGDPIAISYWEWRKPELSIYDAKEAKVRAFPIVQIDKEGLPPAAFFELFNPYKEHKDGETEWNLVTEFNATKYLEKEGITRCTAKWNAVEEEYEVYTEHPDEWRGEFGAFRGGPEGGHANEPNEYHVGAVRFHKLAPDLFICHSVFRFDGTIGGSRVLYLFEVYERDIWSIDYSDAPVRSKLVRYIGAMPIDEVPKFREEWLRRRETESHKDE